MSPPPWRISGRIPIFHPWEVQQLKAAKERLAISVPRAKPSRRTRPSEYQPRKSLASNGKKSLLLCTKCGRSEGE